MENTNDDRSDAAARELELAAGLCARVIADLPTLGREFTRSIRATQPEYAFVPLDDHVQHVTEQQRILLTALGEHRVVGDAGLQRAAALGRLRATQGVSVAAVIGAFHVGNRELWLTLQSYADEQERSSLPGLATLVLRSVESMTSEIVAAYTTVARVRQAQDLMLRQRLIELLERGEITAEVQDTAATLGLDPHGSFIGAAMATIEDPIGEASAVAASLGREQVLTVVHGGVIQVLAQGPSGDDVIAGARAALPRLRLGLGFERAGLAGARESLVDARLCLETTSAQHPVRRFEQDWLRASIRAQRDRLEPVVGDLRAVIDANPHLVETLEVYLDSGFSIAETARVLHLHPNSVAYRLDRWKRLTMWDPKTYRGLAQSMLATLLS